MYIFKDFSFIGESYDAIFLLFDLFFKNILANRNELKFFQDVVV
jgi:hypothetical protein